jgi:hypothetical protein
MDRVALLIEPCLLEIAYEEAPAGAVTEVPMTPAVKDELLTLVPSSQLEFEGEKGIIAQVDDPPHTVLLSLEEMNLSALDVQIVYPQPQGLADLYPCPQKEKKQGPVPDVLNHREKFSHIGGVHSPRQGFRQL